MVELEEAKGEIQKRGLGVAAVSYDSPALLANFAQRKHITYPLLGDHDSKMIRAFNILNENFSPGHAAYGVPFPGTYIVNEKGVVVSRYFEQDHRERYTASNIVVRTLGAGAPEAGTVIETSHLRLRYFASDKVVYPGSLVLLAVDIELKPGMHVYAPGVQGYRPIDWTTPKSAGWLAHPISYPPSHTLHLPVIDETVPVFEGRFRLTRDLTIGQQPDLKPILGPDKTLRIEDTFTYQACDDHMCYLPQNLKLAWTLPVADLDRQRAPAELQKQGKQ